MPWPACVCLPLWPIPRPTTHPATHHPLPRTATCFKSLSSRIYRFLVFVGRIPWQQVAPDVSLGWR